MKSSSNKTAPDLWPRLHHLMLALSLMSAMGAACAHVRLSNQWDSRLRPDQSLVPDDEHEIPRLRQAAGASVTTRTATPQRSPEWSLELAFKLFIDDTAGTTKWTFDPGVMVTGIAAPPAIAGRDLYVVSNGGILYCLRAATPDPVMGTEDWVSPPNLR